MPATNVPCESSPSGAFRLVMMSVDRGERLAVRSGETLETPASITATVIPLPVAPAA